MALHDDYQRGYDEALQRFKVGNALLGYGPSSASTRPAQSVQAAGMAPPMSGAPAAGIGRAPSLAAPVAPQAHKSQVL